MRRPMSDTLKDSSSPNAFGASPLAQPAPPRAFWGLFDRKERWALSWRGRVILAFALVLVGALFLRGVYPFLATTHRLGADVLAVGPFPRHGSRQNIRVGSCAPELVSRTQYACAQHRCSH